jgi:hypothetical protein
MAFVNASGEGSNQSKEIGHLRPFQFDKGSGFSKLQQHMKDVQVLIQQKMTNFKRSVIYFLLFFQNIVSVTSRSGKFFEP